MKPEEERYYVGHRQRLKHRFLNAGADAFADYELIELLLFLAIPRKDVKPLAKRLLHEFGGIQAIINADIDKIYSIKDINESSCIVFKLIKEIINRTMKSKVIKKNAISSWSALIDYLQAIMGDIKVEQFRVLFLNKKNILIADELLATGTIDQAPVYPREIVKRALFHEAGAIILVHNHPAGNPKPSKRDIEMTQKIVEACLPVNITVHDHVIIAGSEYYSFKSNMLL